MNKYKIILIIFFSILSLSNLMAQKGGIKVSGKVVSSYANRPLPDAIITISGVDKTVECDSLGRFSVDGVPAKATISVWCPGFYTKEEPVANREQVQIVMIPEDMKGYSEKVTLPFRGMVVQKNKSTNLSSVSKNGLNLNLTDVEEGFRNIPGLQLISKSGQSQEGSFFSIRGVNTMIANSTPLIVVNGVPYMPDMNESGIIGGYSKDIFNILNVQDIENITVLKGTDAAMYGSLGSNGVIMIETDKAADLDTKVEFIGQYGLSWNTSTLPVLGVDDYKSLMGNVALTKYEDMSDALNAFPYLKDDPEFYYKYLYNNNTDWQDLIYRNAFVTDNVLKIKGGDAIAKYDFSIGVKNKQGTVEETNSSKYYARMNADVTLSKNVSLFSTISFAYTNNRVAEQGMVLETNPLLTALRKGPLFSPYNKDDKNNLLPDFASIRDEDGALIVNNSVSNPLAVVNDVEMKEHAYDVLLDAGLQYRINENWKLKATFGLNYNLKQEDAFVPGMSSMTIMPLDNQLAKNTVRSAEGTTLNTYYALNLSYLKKIAHIHTIAASLGGQIAMNSIDYNAGSGYNTANDYYKTLNNVQSIGRNYFGYINKWNWMNYNASVKYNYNNQFFAGANLAADGSSAVGDDAARIYLYPAVNAAWNIRNTLFKNVTFLNDVNLRTEYVMTGNSRFASSIGEYYYLNRVFKGLSGLVRAGIPSVKITPERTNTWNLGLDVAMFNNRLTFSLDYFDSRSKDLIMPVTISSVYGTDCMYRNLGEVSNKGIEFGAQLALIQNRDFKWYVGGTISTNKNEVKSLGGENSMILSMSDGSAVISEVGQPLYSFYGYQTDGVFATDDAVVAAGKDGQALTNAIGVAFAAGDMRFVDQNGDGKIDKEDRVNLGNALPDFYGTFYTNFQYKGLAVSAVFGYSKGNKMYNAVRRTMESMSDFSNQLTSVTRRWMYEGQITDIPRAVYGDPMENSRFSDRWIEDASYLKLKELMVSYKFNLFAGTTVFVAAENLFTATKYLGMDPETMYSYDSSMRGFDYGKIASPRTVKLGFKVQF